LLLVCSPVNIDITRSSFFRERKTNGASRIEESARTPVVLDVDGEKERFNVSIVLSDLSNASFYQKTLEGTHFFPIFFSLPS
ncbi:MAG: hypothetical protein ABJQ38_18280, partial [Flavobacteriaceae bacterium]